MNKLPVGETIGFAYRFTFGQLGTIIGLIWAPMVVIAVLRFLPYGLGDTTLSPEQNLAAFNAAQLRIVLFGLASLFFYACVCVSVTQQALGLRKGGAIFHFAIGRTELRMWSAFLLLTLILAMLMLGVFLATNGAVMLLARSGNAVLAGGVMLGMLFAGSCLIVFALVRLSFLVAPVCVAEGTMGLERGWRLTRGNFWRISGILFVVTLPVVAVTVCAVLGLIGEDLSKLVGVAPKLTQEVLQNRMQVILGRHMAMMIGIDLIAAPFLLGLTLGASAFAYKTLASASPPPRGAQAKL